SLKTPPRRRMSRRNHRITSRNLFQPTRWTSHHNPLLLKCCNDQLSPPSRQASGLKHVVLVLRGNDPTNLRSSSPCCELQRPGVSQLELPVCNSTWNTLGA